jgi:hypothetical protein
MFEGGVDIAVGGLEESLYAEAAVETHPHELLQ